MNLRSFSGLTLALPASIALFAACGGTADVGSDKSNVNGAGGGNEPGGSAGVVNTPGPGGGAGEAGSSQGGAAGSGQAGTTQGGASQGGSAGAAGSGQAGSGAGGAMCGGFAGFQCAKDQWCDYDGPNCGAADGAGVCRTRPEVCDTLYSPVCGCDGQMYSNECTANAAGTDATTDTSCFPQDGGTAPGNECKVDGDCTLVDNYCGGCHCLSLAPGESAPKCTDPVNCFAEPCMNKTAACVAGSCVSQ